MNAPEPAQARAVQRLLWGALVASQLVYVGVLLSGLLPIGDAPSLPAVLPGAFGALAAGHAAGAHWLWRRATGAGEPLHARPRDPARIFPWQLLAWALDESVGIFGFVLGVLSFPPADWAGFFAASVLLLLLHRPQSA